MQKSENPLSPCSLPPAPFPLLPCLFGKSAKQKKPPIPGGLKVSGENLSIYYCVATAITPPNAEKIAETVAVANSHQDAEAAALRVSSACRCA